MSSGDKTADKLVASIRKTKVGAQSDTSESTSSPKAETKTTAAKPGPATKAQAKKTAPAKPSPKAKAQPKKAASKQTKATVKQDPFSVGGRVWPD